MAESSVSSPLARSIVGSSHPWWSVEERLHALEQARNAAVPSRNEEDWRRTDPELFPWNQLDVALPAQLQTEVRSSIPEHIKEGDERDELRAVQLIAGDDYDSKFLYFHRALSQSPVVLRIPAGWAGDTIDIHQSILSEGLGVFSTVIVVEAGANVKVVDRWSLSDDRGFAIGRVEIVVKAGGKLAYVWEDECGSQASVYRRGRIRAERDSEVTCYSFTRGAEWHVTRLELLLAGRGSYGVIRGLFSGGGGAHAEHRTHQHHASPNAKSDLLFKTLLSGHAQSVYQGLISVPAPAQKTDAYQQCRNLLLDPGTRADAIPKLEIIADDVRCTHGASMGSLNPEHLFYLQSRGLSKQQAARTIAMGFAEEVIAQVPIESARERWRNAVMNQVQVSRLD